MLNMQVGWGIFYIQATVFFKPEWSHPPVRVAWLLDFDEEGSYQETELTFNPPTPPTPPAPLLALPAPPLPPPPPAAAVTAAGGGGGGGTASVGAAGDGGSRPAAAAVAAGAAARSAATDDESSAPVLLPSSSSSEDPSYAPSNSDPWGSAFAGVRGGSGGAASGAEVSSGAASIDESSH